jgi:hypothetical protein
MDGKILVKNLLQASSLVGWFAGQLCAFVLCKLMSKPGGWRKGGEEEVGIKWSVAPKGIFLPRYARPSSPQRHLETVLRALEDWHSYYGSGGRKDRRPDPHSTIENIRWLGNLNGDYYVESIALRSKTPTVLSLIKIGECKEFLRIDLAEKAQQHLTEYLE